MTSPRSKGARRVNDNEHVYIVYQKECGCEYISVHSTGAFYEARVCSDADLLDTVLNMLERM